MGGDGGSIPKRIELVRSRQKPEQVAKEAELAARWRHCQLSQELLNRPIVACHLGRMYNKTAALEFLLDREKYGTSGAGAAAASAASPFACPLSGVEMNGRFRFVFPWSCGCALAEKAVDQLLKSAPNRQSLACPSCQQPDAMSDLIVLNPATDAEVAAASEAMVARKRKLRQESKSNKSSKSAAAAPAAAKRKQQPAESASASSTGSKIARPSGSSIQNNPKASAALKSLLTSSKEAKAQDKAHWVTFNPGYFR
uniref:Replication termination factor 2 n=1 Tax=Macrostomum lignano TaxID=282301 RepID=A0A1I8G7H8_9PLAT